MTIKTKIKSCHKPTSFKNYADFEFNSKIVKSYEWFRPKKCQSDNLARWLYTNNQQK